MDDIQKSMRIENAARKVQGARSDAAEWIQRLYELLNKSGKGMREFELFLSHYTEDEQSVIEDFQEIIADLDAAQKSFGDATKE